MGDDDVQLADYNGHKMSKAEAAIVEWHLYRLWLHGMMTDAMTVQPGFHNLGKHAKTLFSDTFYCITVLLIYILFINFNDLLAVFCLHIN